MTIKKTYPNISIKKTLLHKIKKDSPQKSSEKKKKTPKKESSHFGGNHLP